MAFARAFLAAAHHRPDPEILARCTGLRALQVALFLVIYEDFGDMVGRNEGIRSMLGVLAVSPS
jgi:hypothetical protein